MNKYNTSPEQLTVARQLLRWTLLVLPVALAAGSLVALFLWLLEWATQFRWAHSWLLYGLPFAGIGIYWLYRLAGRNAEKGNNLIMEEIHQPGGGVPARMAPLVLLTTIITHLFGGSAGREGTAVQIGGSIAGWIARKLGLTPKDTRILLMTGIAAGFGAVFGTPVTGAVFALEVLAIGVMRYDALVPCLIAAVLADWVCSAWGITHTHYSIHYTGKAVMEYWPFVHLDLWLLVKVILGGVAFGLSSFLFSTLMHRIKHHANAYIKIPWLVPFAGGLLIIGLTFVAGTTDYLGLGVHSASPDGISIVAAFDAGHAINPWSWLWKLVFTAITLGMGFKGGEVTPLFFIGATLGHTLAVLLGAPVDLFAGLGFVAVFAGATNTPIACTLMGIELFGADHTLYLAVACFTAYYFSGHTGIYGAQRLGVPKYTRPE
ncbi:voltage-gated chloride channel family protein [Chitinophaga nivalis]|uniref:Voltage-gated chloride channel family protein n=1 Tax=Chitinophaga nivalis TaxID=2991709 RepID=A0ABT3IKZ1_9BACT|nr:voltage-gated chloride channel family protein [Chitinophaga nivalis]MCW3465696.1 voltage-gated chloride channel family protein [Chitinophaga nivalis]MCW3484613.1 voltage-gated chloride channel family protein [Chitinophaga nivalis]